MSVTSKNEGKKWIQSSVAIVCMLVGYVFISFFEQLGEWFELEAKVANYAAASQVLSVLIGLGAFVYIMKNAKTSVFLEEVFEEVVKVVWPDKNETVKHTIGIMIAVTIVGTILGLFDVAAGYLLSLIS